MKVSADGVRSIQRGWDLYERGGAAETLSLITLSLAGKAVKGCRHSFHQFSNELAWVFRRQKRPLLLLGKFLWKRPLRAGLEKNEEMMKGLDACYGVFGRQER